MVNHAAAIAGLRGWRRGVTAFGAGVLGSVAVAPLHLWPALLVSLTLLVWLLDGCAARGGRWKDRLMEAAATGWCFGFGYFLIGLYWVGAAFLVEAERFAVLLPLAVSLLPAGLALFYAGATALAALAWRTGPARIIALAAAFTFAEIARGTVLTGFPWNALGYALTAPLALAQSASVFGVHGLTFWSVAILAAPAALVGNAAPGEAVERRGIVYAGAMALVLLSAAAWGTWRLDAAGTAMVSDIRLRLVQPAIPQHEKWKPEKKDWIFGQLIDNSKRDGRGRVDDLAGVTHVIWPESSVPFLLLRAPEALKRIADLLPDHTHLIVGAMRMEEIPESQRTTSRNRHYYNSLMALDTNARLTAVYDKMHLVPFGEYLPRQNLLESIGLEQLARLRGGFTSGEGPRHLSLAGVPAFTPLICYEAIFPGRVNTGNPAPSWLLNVTNDAWFGRTAGPHQHFHQAGLRAVEQGVPLVRVANNGISGVIGPYGRVRARLELDERGTLDTGLPEPAPATVYARFGDAVLVLLAIIAAAAYFALSWRRDA